MSATRRLAHFGFSVVLLLGLAVFAAGPAQGQAPGFTILPSIGAGNQMGFPTRGFNGYSFPVFAPPGGSGAFQYWTPRVPPGSRYYVSPNEALANNLTGNSFDPYLGSGFSGYMNPYLFTSGLGYNSTMYGAGGYPTGGGGGGYSGLYNSMYWRNYGRSFGSMYSSGGGSDYVGGGGGGGYGGGGGAKGNASLSSSRGPSAVVEDRRGSPRADSVFAARGLPTEGDHLAWPFGLRLMDDRESEGLKKQVEAAFRISAETGGRGPANSRFVRDGYRAIDRLSAVLKDKERGGLATGTYEESAKFLAKLRRSLKES